MAKLKSPPVRPLPPSPELALLIGVVLGDGCITRHEKCECLSIACHEDQSGWISELKGLLYKLFGKECSVFSPCWKKYLYLRVYKKGISTALGLPPGNKIRNAVGIPGWIKESPDFMIPCLRGLFETDGCFAVREAKHVYFVEFTNHNRRLLDDCETLLRNLGFHPQRGRRYVRPAQTQEIHRFCEWTGSLKAELSRIPSRDLRRVRRGIYVECALEGCTTLVYRRPSAQSLSGEFFCSPEHAAMARRTVRRPSASELREGLERGMSWTALGKQYGVSDNAVRKWAKHYGLTIPTRKPRRSNHQW